MVEDSHTRPVPNQGRTDSQYNARETGKRGYATALSDMKKAKTTGMNAGR